MADLTVMGAGVFGLSVAWAAARRGATVRVIDPSGPGAGASGGIVGALAPHVPDPWNAKKAFQLESLLMANGWWAEVAETGGGDPGYARTGRLQPLADERAVALACARAGAARERWRGAVWEVLPVTGDWHPPSPTALMIHDTLTARIHPRKATAALAKALCARGGGILTEGAPSGPVVWATGWAGLEALSRGRPRAMGGGVKGQAALLRLDRHDMPQLFAEGVHFVPHGDGTLAIGSTTERDFAEPATTDAALNDLITRARALVPAIADAQVIERWAGVRPRARSRAPMLGPCPERPGHFIANGGFKIGFGMAPLVGEVMADLVLEGRDRIPPDFRVEASL